MPLTITADELAAWIRLSLEPGLGPAQARMLLAAIGLPQDIYALPATMLRKHVPAELASQMAGPPSDTINDLVERTMQWAQQPRHHILTLADGSYPRALLDTSDPPLMLYANGNLSLLARPCMAVVGARSATAGGTDNAQAFSRHLAAAGWTIVSGLALGIDAAAHEGALLAGAGGGSTIAVLGTGIDMVYPARHRDLAHRIAENGLLLSELALGTRALPWQFPRRNRLVAGLSRGVLVVEAARQSGSLITARLAAELGREVFAIPGSIHSPLSRGCHDLIRQGAKLVESGQDIHDELSQPAQHDFFAPTNTATNRTADNSTNRATSGAADTASSTAAETAANLAAHVPAARSDEALDDDSRAVVGALGYDPVHPDILLQRTGMDMANLTTALLQLELSGRVTKLANGCFQRT